jgi:hypothetical protein
MTSKPTARRSNNQGGRSARVVSPASFEPATPTKAGGRSPYSPPSFLDLLSETDLQGGEGCEVRTLHTPCTPSERTERTYRMADSTPHSRRNSRRSDRPLTTSNHGRVRHRGGGRACRRGRPYSHCAGDVMARTHSVMTDHVVITWKTPSVIAASVLDPDVGVVDVRLARWSLGMHVPTGVRLPPRERGEVIDRGRGGPPMSPRTGRPESSNNTRSEGVGAGSALPPASTNDPPVILSPGSVEIATFWGRGVRSRFMPVKAGRLSVVLGLLLEVGI